MLWAKRARNILLSCALFGKLLRDFGEFPAFNPAVLRWKVSRMRRSSGLFWVSFSGRRSLQNSWMVTSSVEFRMVRGQNVSLRAESIPLWRHPVWMFVNAYVANCLKKPLECINPEFAVEQSLLRVFIWQFVNCSKTSRLSLTCGLIHQIVSARRNLFLVHVVSSFLSHLVPMVAYKESVNYNTYQYYDNLPPTVHADAKYNY